MSTSEIIATKLPPGMEKASNFYRRETGIRTGIEQEFIQAQREAILRFCQAVEKEVENTLEIQSRQAGKLLNFEYNSKYAAAINKLKAGISPQTEPSQKPDPSQSDC